MGGKRHRFLPTGHDDAGIAAGDLLHADGDRAQARSTDLVQPPGGRFLRNAGGNRSLARRILSLTRGQHLTEDNLVNLGCIDAGARQHLADRDGPEFVRRGCGECAVEGADRRARGTGDDDGGSGHGGFLELVGILASANVSCPITGTSQTGM